MLNDAIQAYQVGNGSGTWVRHQQPFILQPLSIGYFQHDERLKLCAQPPFLLEELSQ